MKDRFNWMRFFHYARMHYLNNGKSYLGLMIASFILVVGCCTGWEVKSIHLTIESGSIENCITSYFSPTYALLGILFCLFVTYLSMRGLHGRWWGISDMMLPISSGERYLFMLLNSTVVSLSLYTLIFYLGGQYVESLYYFNGDLEYIYTGLFNTDGFDVASQPGFVHRNMFSLKSLFGIFIASPPDVVLSFCEGYMFLVFLLVSIAMWAHVSNINAVIALLLHLLIGGAVIYLISLILVPIPSTILAHRVSFRMSSPIASESVERSLEIFVWITVVLYQWVTWKKLKNYEVKK